MRTLLRRLPVSVALFALLLAPALASAEAEKFKPDLEFQLDDYIPIHLGPLNMSINKAVIYMLVSSLICVLVGIFVVRGGLKMKPTKAQNVVELAYEFAEKNIARATLTNEGMMRKWFPYLATLFMFIGVNNLISFIPLPFGHEKGWGGIAGNLSDLSLYAATANINVTLALTLLSFGIFNVEGIRTHGFGGYLKTLVPSGVSGPMKGVVAVLEGLSLVLRLVSLSVRLFANVLAGHLLIIMSAGFAVLLGNYAGLIAIPFGVFFYFLEWVLIAGLQAFIFAMLSGIYIGFATEASH